MPMIKTISVDEEVFERLWDLKYEMRVRSLNAVLRKLLGLPDENGKEDRPSSAVAGEDLSDVPVSP